MPRRNRPADALPPGAVPAVGTASGRGSAKASSDYGISGDRRRMLELQYAQAVIEREALRAQLVAGAQARPRPKREYGQRDAGQTMRQIYDELEPKGFFNGRNAMDKWRIVLRPLGVDEFEPGPYTIRIFRRMLRIRERELPK
jgi:hypothetical protein